MTPYLRLACIALALALPFAALQVEATRRQADGARLQERVPDRVGEWSAVEDHELEPEVVEMLSPESYSMRFFEAEGRPGIWIYAAFYRGDGPSSPHDPLICYPAAGWSVSEDREEPLEIGNGEAFPVRFMRGELSGANEVVLYWRQPAKRWPRSMPAEYFLRLRDRVLGRPQYAFVRISLRRPTSLDGVPESDMAALRAAAAALAPWAREATGAGSEL